MGSHVPPMQPTSLPAGRYEFKDAGLYIGEWLNERAVGLGLITKDKCQGEYTGLWEAGFEKSGVFLWPNAPGAMYEGEWGHNRRNGYGIFTREDWVIMGKFVDDFISLGVKCKEGSIGRYEGKFEDGFPSFGVETYADGGNYAGEYKSGVREGLGVRTSIPYGQVINFFPEEAALAAEMAMKAKCRTRASPLAMGIPSCERRGSLLSQRSVGFSEMDDDDEEAVVDTGGIMGTGHLATPTAAKVTSANRTFQELRKSCKFKCGFVLSSQPSELMLRRQIKLAGCTSSFCMTGLPTSGAHPRKSRDTVHRGGQPRARSLTNLLHRSFSRESINRLIRRQNNSTEQNNLQEMKNKYPDSIFTLDQEDAIDPETYETFAGQWDSDTRHGFGVCERSDGVIYEGQWFQNKRHGYGQTRFRDGSCEQGRYQNGKLVFLSWTKGAKAHLLLYNYHIKRSVAYAVERARAVAETARERANEARENLDTVANAMEHAKQAAEVARDYSLETRELVKEMYPDFEQPGLKYLEKIVQLMRVTKRGNQAFESAFLAAQDVINGVGTAGLSEVLNGEHTPNHLDALPDDHALEGHSPPGSRAGSYRRRRRSRQVSKRLSRQIKASTEGQDVFLRAPDNIEQPCEESTVVESYMPNLSVTLLVPQITNYDLNDQGSPGNHVDVLTNLTPNSHDCMQPTRALKPTKSPPHDFLSVPTPHEQGQFPIGEDSEDSVESVDVRPRVSRSPSVLSTYVTIPHVNELQPTSEIPHIPLSRLIENCNLLDDHFSHYKKNQATASPAFDQATAIPTGSVSQTKRPVDEQRRNPADDWIYSIPPDDGFTEGLRKPIDRNAVGTQPQWFGRRRTLPAFLTQQPPTIATSTMPNTVADRTSENPSWMNSMTAASPDTETLHDKPTTLLSADQVAPVVEGSSQHTQHMAESVIYLLDEGVRKRLRAQPSETTRLLHSPDYPLSLHQTRIEPLQNIRPRRDRQGHETTHETRLGLPSLSEQTKEVRQPLCVGNVLLEDLQDELAPLPTEFKESNIDYRQQKPGRLSVPYLPDYLAHSSGAAGLTPEEISLLAEESLRKREDEAARKRQGEIVIHLVDLFDWCNRNLLIIVVITANCLLVYCFLILLFNEEAQDQT